MRSVTAREANQNFSKLLAEAAQGVTVVITRRGAPVAKLTPYDGEEERRRRDAAHQRLMALIDSGIDLGGEKFDRDSLYER